MGDFMKKISLIILLIVLSLIVFVGCSNKSLTSAPAKKSIPVSTSKASDVKQSSLGNNSNSSPVLKAATDRIIEETKSDINNDGIVDNITIIKREQDYYLTISCNKNNHLIKDERLICSNDYSKGDISGHGTKNTLSAKRVTTSLEQNIIVEYSIDDIGSIQLSIYGVDKDYKLMNLINEPYAVDTGIISLTDIDNDGIYERVQNKEDVIRYFRYVPGKDNALRFKYIKAEPVEEFNFKDPGEVVEAYIYYRCNDIKDYIDKVVINNELKSKDILNISKYGDAWPPFVIGYQGYITGDFKVLDKNENSAKVQADGESATNPDNKVSLEFDLQKQNDGTWKINDIKKLK